MYNKYCSDINIKHVGKKVKICGWVDKYRSLKNLIFIDIRDREGTVQVIFYSDNLDIFQKALKLRNEFCIQVIGKVSIRKTINFNKKNGDIEIIAIQLKIFNSSKSLPLDYTKKNSEKMRLKYRYLDLRRLEMINNFKIRSKIINLIHVFMEKHGCLNIDTPILTHSTPEGAKDYLIPSRFKGKFYALPQSPQIFKQLLMIAGFGKYYQIAKCFRDEDLRADRQPEFTQLDIEMSFISSKKIRNFTEKLIIKLWDNIKNIKLNKFPVISFQEAINRYGSDKPDLRNPLELKDITNLLKYAECSFFSNFIKKKAISITIPQILLNHKKINIYFEFIKKIQIKNIFYILLNEKNNIYYINNFVTYKKKISKFFIKKIIDLSIAKIGDTILFSIEKDSLIYNAFGILRNEIAKDLKILNNKFNPLWITNFPMFEINSEKILKSVHHPFTAPKNNITINYLKKFPHKIFSDSYDLVINGYEIGGGSTRINNYKLQKTVFDILGIDKLEQKKRFGFFLEALKYGTPPHAGIAFGLDRIIMLLLNKDNIKEIIAFPKTNSAFCLMTDTPHLINKNVLKELNIKIIN